VGGLFFFFRAEDGIRDLTVTGVQTCALPICRAAKMVVLDLDHPDVEQFINWKVTEEQKVAALVAGSKACNRHLNAVVKACRPARSEERRVGKEWRSRRWAVDRTKNRRAEESW